MKPEVHKLLTEIAIKKCCSKLSQDFKDYKKEIIQGTIDEDEWRCERVINWHFYKSNDNILYTENKWYGIPKTSSLDIFKQRIYQMNSFTKKDKEYYNYLGRIIHHIQDMNTPSHVVPIYHDIFKRDFFERFMLKYMDKSKLTKEVDLTNKKLDFEALYERVAQTTLEYIRDKEIKVRSCNKENVSISLDMFWREYDNKHKSMKGFGTFGDFHIWFLMPKLFQIICKKGLKPELYELKNINNDICNKAIQDTCDTLIYADKGVS